MLTLNFISTESKISGVLKSLYSRKNTYPAVSLSWPAGCPYPGHEDTTVLGHLRGRISDMIGVSPRQNLGQDFGQD